MMSDEHLSLVEKAMRKDCRSVCTAYRRIRQKNQRAEVRFDGLAGRLRTLSGGSSKQIVLVAGQSELRM
jgi:DNA (cytosine-5)-methyltransferase 1